MTVLANGPPTIASASVSPATLRFAGGEVTIVAQITDDESVASVDAEVARPRGTEPVVLTGTGTTYVGSYAAPANPGPEAATYTVTIRATDNGGYARTSATTPSGFSVSPPPDPPLPPEG